MTSNNEPEMSAFQPKPEPDFWSGYNHLSQFPRMLPLPIGEDGLPFNSTIMADEENLAYEDLPEDVRHPITSPAQLRAAPWVLRRHFDARNEWDDLTPAQAVVERPNDQVATLTTEQQLSLERQQRINVEAVLDILRIDHAAALRQTHHLSNQFQADEGHDEPEKPSTQHGDGLYSEIGNYTICSPWPAREPRHDSTIYPPLAALGPRHDSLFGSLDSNHSDDDEYSAHGSSKWPVSTDSASGLMCEDCMENPPRNSRHADTGDICCTTCGLILSPVLNSFSVPVVSPNSQEETAAVAQPEKTAGEDDMAAQVQKLQDQLGDADVKIASLSKNISLEQELSGTTFKRMNALLRDMTSQRDIMLSERDNLTTIVNKLLDPSSSIDSAKGVEHTNIIGAHDLQVRFGDDDFQRLLQDLNANDNNNFQEWLRGLQYPAHNAAQQPAGEEAPMADAAGAPAQEPRQDEANRDDYHLIAAELDEMRIERDLTLRDFERQEETVERQAKELQQAREDFAAIQGQRDALEEIRVTQAAELDEMRFEQDQTLRTLEFRNGIVERQAAELRQARQDIAVVQGQRDALEEIRIAQEAEVQQARQEAAAADDHLYVSDELTNRLQTALTARDNLRAEVIRRAGRVVGENGEVEGEDGIVPAAAVPAGLPAAVPSPAPAVLVPTGPAADIPEPPAPVRRSTRVPIPTRRSLPSPPPLARRARQPARARTPAEPAGPVPGFSRAADVARPASSTPGYLSGTRSSTARTGTKRKAQGEKEKPSKRKK